MPIADQTVAQGYLCMRTQAKVHPAVKHFDAGNLQLATTEKSQGIQLCEIENNQSVGSHSEAFLLIYLVSTHPAGVLSVVSSLCGDSLI